MLASLERQAKQVLSMFPWAFLFLAPPQSPSLLPAATNQASETPSAATFPKKLNEIRLESIFPPCCVLSLSMTEQVLQHFLLRWFFSFFFFFKCGSWHSFRDCFFQNYSGQLSASNQICQVKPSAKFPICMLDLVCLTDMHMAWLIPHATVSFVKNHRIRQSLGLEKTFKTIKSNYKPKTAKSKTKPCP